MDHSGGGHYQSGRVKPFEVKHSKMQTSSLLASPVKAEAETSSYMVGCKEVDNVLLGEIPKLASSDPQSDRLKKCELTSSKLNKIDL